MRSLLEGLSNALAWGQRERPSVKTATYVEGVVLVEIIGGEL